MRRGLAITTNIVKPQPAHCACVHSNSNAYSLDGLTWISNPISIPQRGFAYSPSLGLFVSISAGSLTLATSTDGIVWTNRSSAIPAPHYNSAGAAIWVDELKAFFVGVNGGVAKSTDGILWDVIGTAQLGSYTVRNISWAKSINKLFISTGDYGWTSTNGGLSWTYVNHSFGYFVGMEWSPVLNRQVVLNTDRYIKYSDDLVTWTTSSTQLSSANNTTSQIRWVDKFNKFIMSAYNGYYSSSDGVNWSHYSIPNLHSTVVAYLSKSDLVAMGDTNGNLHTSPDLSTWTDRGKVTGTTNQFASII